MAQHHGLPTRLLDWTQNILVALYFAVEANPDADGEVLALLAPKKQGSQSRSRDPLAIARPTKLYPHIVVPRIRAQEGLFVVCSELDTCLSRTLRTSWQLERLHVPREAKPRLRYELFRVGVHASTLFPDVDGLAARLRWQHSVGPTPAPKPSAQNTKAS